jgi:hypothetical protein
MQVFQIVKVDIETINGFSIKRPSDKKGGFVNIKQGVLNVFLRLEGGD